jgi:hypothetical protein
VERHLRALTAVGPRRLVGIAAHRAWSNGSSLGLRADLKRLPPRPEARVSVEMAPVALAEFEAFAEALPHATGQERVELLQRELMRERGVETLYVSTAADGRPVYVQWLVLPDAQEPLHEATGGLYPRLQPDEALVEGAYTFPDFRGLAAMAAGMWDLLDTARRVGATTAYTYVTPTNVPSLRGCARAGFGLDHVRLEQRRAGRTRIERARPDAAAGHAWRVAVG